MIPSKYQIQTIPSPTMLDLAPNDFLFPKLKEFMKGHKCAGGIRALKKCWTKCISFAGDCSKVTKYDVHIM